MTATFDHELVARLRKSKGLSYTQLAGLVGATEGAVRRWEAGENVPGIVLGVKLARALEVRAEQLVTDAA